MSNNRKDKDTIELCAGGRILETSVVGNLDSIKDMLADQKESFVGLAQQIRELTEYSIRDNEKIEVLEKSRDCKSKKLNLLDEDVQEIDKDFATHLGEHEATKKLEGATGRRWGFFSGSGVIVVFEFCKYVLTGKGG